MNAIQSDSAPVTRYELPPHGITLLGYVVRRLHKTSLLLPVQDLLDAAGTAEALAQVGYYAALASASFGPAYYQPAFNAVGEVIQEPDPATGALVTARLAASTPHLRITCLVQLPDGSRFQGTEEITGTTISLHGLGMPAPSQFDFVTASGDYRAHMVGMITSELVPGLFTTSRIRAHGSLRLSDNAGNAGRLKLTRGGDVHIAVTPLHGPVLVKQERRARAGD